MVAVFRALTEEQLHRSQAECTDIEKQTGIEEHTLNLLLGIAKSEQLSIILRPVNPIAITLMKFNAVGKEMYVHGKSAEESLAMGFIPLRSSISKAGKENNIKNIQKYNKENNDAIAASNRIILELREACKLQAMELQQTKKSQIVMPVNLLDQNGNQIFIFENESDLALRDSDGNYVCAIKDKKDKCFQQIDKNHQPIKSMDLQSDQEYKGYQRAIPLQVFGKPQIIQYKNGELKIEDVRPITADIDVLAYGYKMQLSGRRYSDVGNSSEVEGLEGIGDCTEVVRNITHLMRDSFPNCEISHGSEQFNLRFTQPLDKKWICIYPSSGEVKILNREQDLVDVFNEFRKKGFNMLPNPNWGWRLEGSKYTIDATAKKLLQELKELADEETDSTISSYILTERLKLAIAWVTKNQYNQYESLPTFHEILSAKTLEPLEDILQSFRNMSQYLEGISKVGNHEVGKNVLHNLIYLDRLKDFGKKYANLSTSNYLIDNAFLTRAIDLGSIELVKYLVNNDIVAIEDVRHFLTISLYSGSLVKLFIKKYQNIYDKDKNIYDKDDDGFTILNYAAEMPDNLGVVQLLVEALFELDQHINLQQKEILNSALISAVQSLDYNIVLYLINKGASTEYKYQNHTALDYAKALSNRLAEQELLSKNLVVEKLISNHLAAQALLSKNLVVGESLVELLSDRLVLGELLSEHPEPRELLVELLSNRLTVEELLLENLEAEKLLSNHLAEQELLSNILAEQELLSNILAVEKLLSNHLAAQELLSNILAVEKLLSNHLAAQQEGDYQMDCSPVAADMDCSPVAADIEILGNTTNVVTEF